MPLENEYIWKVTMMRKIKRVKSTLTLEVVCESDVDAISYAKMVMDDPSWKVQSVKMIGKAENG